MSAPFCGARVRAAEAADPPRRAAGAPPNSPSNRSLRSAVPPASKPPGKPSNPPPRPARSPPAAAAAAETAAAERHLGIAVLVDLAAVVARALVLVGQDVIGLRDLAEALGGLGIVLVAVGVKLLGEAAIGLLDLGLARAALDSQPLIQIHAHALLRNSRCCLMHGLAAGAPQPRGALPWPTIPSPCSTPGSPRRGQRAQRPGGDGARHRRRRRPAVGADGAAEGPRARRLRLLHQPRQPQGRRARRQSACAPCCSTGSRCAARSAIEGPVEPVSEADADAYFATRGRDFAARRLGLRPVAPARRAGRPSRRGSKRCSERFDGQPCRARRAGRAIAWSAAADRILDRPRRTGCTSGACSPAHGDGWNESLLYP